MWLFGKKWNKKSTHKILHLKKSLFHPQIQTTVYKMWISSLKRGEKIQVDLSFLSVVQGCWLRETPQTHHILQTPACAIQSRSARLIFAVFL